MNGFVAFILLLLFYLFYFYLFRFVDVDSVFAFLLFGLGRSGLCEDVWWL